MPVIFYFLNMYVSFLLCNRSRNEVGMRCPRGRFPAVAITHISIHFTADKVGQPCGTDHTYMLHGRGLFY